MKIYLASDHAGFELKEHLISYLEENGFEVIDKGPHTYQAGDDYPDWISLVGDAISKDPLHSKGIVLGMSGQGEALVANKYKSVRAGVFYGGDREIVKLLRQHNDANVLSLGAKFLTNREAEQAVDVFIETQFSGDERHKRRLEKMKNFEDVSMSPETYD